MQPVSLLFSLSDALISTSFTGFNSASPFLSDFCNKENLNFSCGVKAHLSSTFKDLAWFGQIFGQTSGKNCRILGFDGT